MIDISKLGLPREKKYSDSTLKAMTKADLIDYIRTLESNYDAQLWFNIQQAKNFENMLKYMSGTTKLDEVTE